MTFTALPPAIAALLLALVAAAGVYDMRFRRIPNWLSASGIVLGLAINAFLGFGWPGLRFSLAGLLTGFGAYFVLYLLRAMGAGDVKLMAAIGAMTGWHDWIGVFLITSLFGGAVAIVLITLRGRFRKTLWNVSFIFSEMKSGRPAYVSNEELDVRSSKALRLPHGAVIAAGTVIFLVLCARFG